MNRRYFLMGAAGALASTQVKSHLLASPNSTVRVAVVGVHGQGNAHLKQYAKMPNVEIAAMCDIDEGVFNRRARMRRKRRPGRSLPAIGRSVSCWKISRLTPFPSPLPTIAIPAGHLGVAGRETRILRKAVRP